MGSAILLNLLHSILNPFYIIPVCFGLLFLKICWMYRILLCFVTAILLFSGEKAAIIAMTFRRDVKYVYKIWRAISLNKKYEKNNDTVAKIFRENCSKTPKKACFLYEDQVYTFLDIEEMSNKVGHVFLAQGFGQGDVVAILMPGHPHYVCSWLGLSKVGVVAALLNPNIRSASLTHSITIAKAKALIYSSDFRSVVEELDLAIEKYEYQLPGAENKNGLVGDSAISLNALLTDVPSSPPVPRTPAHYSDKLLYIYTSGTTGMPKAAIILSSRFLIASEAARAFLSLEEDDILYNCLPLSHSSGGCLGIGPALIAGITVAIRPKFSASNYFKDCNKYRATVGLYIGEMCRYMIATKPSAEDTTHKVRALLGNGLRPAIWAQFKERFLVPNIFEFYGATEGNVNMCNLDNKIGAVGYIPNIIPSSLYPIAIVKADPETGAIERRANGLCIRSKPGDPGMLVGLIKTSDPTRKFEGYVDKNESSKKIIKNVFKKGDSAFISGDLVVMDDLGYIYFKDRTGDTFRWKGENVSSSEVEAVITKYASFSDCVVYGVQVGDLEGKAGMVALVGSPESLNLNGLAQAVDSSLPSYARPLFLRLVPSVELTSTFKLRKVDLQQLGVDPSNSPSTHQLFFRQGPSFVPFTPSAYSDIIEGRTKI